MTTHSQSFKESSDLEDVVNDNKRHTNLWSTDYIWNKLCKLYYIAVAVKRTSMKFSINRRNGIQLAPFSLQSKLGLQYTCKYLRKKLLLGRYVILSTANVILYDRYFTKVRFIDSIKNSYLELPILTNKGYLCCKKMGSKTTAILI